MSTYHLQARLLSAPPGEPTRDDVLLAESDSWEELNVVADQLVADGFTVWLFDHGSPNPIPNASDYRLITHLHPEPTAPHVASRSHSLRSTTTRRR